MGLLTQLATQATNARNAYVGGQDQGRADSIKRALLEQQSARQRQEDALKDAFMKAQTSKLLQPPPAPKPDRDPVADANAQWQYRVDHPAPVTEKPAAPHNPVIGSDAWKEAERFKASLRPDPIARTERTQRPTEGQEKSQLFYDRMSAAEPAVDAAMKTGRVRKAALTAYLAAGEIPMVGGIADAAAHSQLNADEQSLIRAFREFAAGVLRKETGAGLSRGELRDVWQRYGPGFGDNPALDGEKSTARKAYMETMRKQSIPATQYYDRQDQQHPSGGGQSEAEWAKTNKPHPGESFEAYHARYLQSRGGD